MLKITSTKDTKKQYPSLQTSQNTEEKESPIDVENRLRRKRRLNIPMLQTNLRLASVRKLIAGRHPNVEPSSPMQHVYYEAVLPLLVWKAEKQNNRPVDSMMWATLWTPALVREHPPEWFYEQEARAGTKFLNDDEFGRLLAVEFYEIQAFGLRRIGAEDKLRDEREAERKEAKKAKDRERRRQKRLEDGATPRSQSLAQTKPWDDENISESTYHRRKRLKLS